jgi:hypothetical protein
MTKPLKKFGHGDLPCSCGGTITFSSILGVIPSSLQLRLFQHLARGHQEVSKSSGVMVNAAMLHCPGCGGASDGKNEACVHYTCLLCETKFCGGCFKIGCREMHGDNLFDQIGRRKAQKRAIMAQLKSAWKQLPIIQQESEKKELFDFLTYHGVDLDHAKIKKMLA